MEMVGVVGAEPVKTEVPEEGKRMLVEKFINLGTKLGLKPETINIIHKELVIPEAPKVETPVAEVPAVKVIPAEQPAEVKAEISPLQVALGQKMGY